jgi:hypothetical protein
MALSSRLSGRVSAGRALVHVCDPILELGDALVEV